MTEWKLDPAHTKVGFAVRHMMVTTVNGEFNAFDAKLNFNPDDLAAASVEATIQAASINTGTADRDNHLRSTDFFDAENFPVLTFKSTHVELTGEDTAKVTGDLTIRNVTRQVALDVEFLGQQPNPFTGQQTLGFEATAKINREDFGLTWNQALETGGVLVGKDIKIKLDVQAVPVGEAAAV